MSWVRIDDRVLYHPKFIGLAPTAFRAWVAALTWSSAQRTDGYLPAAVLPTLQATTRDARVLVARELWESADGGGWRIHDYGDYQLVNGDLARKRSAAGRAGARARWHPDDNGMANAIQKP